VGVEVERLRTEERASSLTTAQRWIDEAMIACGYPRISNIGRIHGSGCQRSSPVSASSDVVATGAD
jgi:hypothetical protein